jgi:nucleotide-binding universal stress UspA family protein
MMAPQDSDTPSTGMRGMRVLLASDGSQPAEVAHHLVRSVAWPPGSMVRVVSAVEPLDTAYIASWAAGIGVDVEAAEESATAQAEAVLEKAARTLVGTSATVERAVLRGRPASCIVEDARAFMADVIVLGSRGHGTIASMVLGSVAGEVVDHAPCPVLVARVPHITRVILAHDGSDFASAAERTLVEWPLFGHATIEVVSVSRPPGPWLVPAWAILPEPSIEDHVEAARAELEHHRQVSEGVARRMRGAGLRATAVVEVGDPATAIMDVAEAHQADLIAVGTHGRSGLERLFLGSVARNVMQHAHVSVLVVRPATEPARHGRREGGQ